jgi:hypothetical protein
MNARQNGSRLEIHFQDSCMNKKINKCHEGPGHHQEINRKWYLYDNMMFLFDYVLQHKIMECYLSSSHIDHFKNDTSIEESVEPDTKEDQETAGQEVRSQTTDNSEYLENVKSINELVFKKP